MARKIEREDLSTQIEDAVDALPGLEPSFSQPIRDNVLESISQIDGQIVIKVFGDDPADAAREGRRGAARRLCAFGAYRARFIDRAGQVPQLQIEVDRARAARYGLNVADVQDVIETALGGKVATEDLGGRAPVRRRGPAATSSDRRDIGGDQQHPGRHAGGAARAAGATSPIVSVRSGSMNISRESGTRLAAIGVFIRGRDMGSIVAGDAGAASRANVKFPPGYYVTWGGEFENQQRAMKRLGLIVPISVFLIFLLLFNAFGSVRNAAVDPRQYSARADRRHRRAVC